MITLAVNNEKGYVKIANQYFQKGSIKPAIEGNELLLFDARDSNRAPVARGEYDDFTDADSGAFSDFNELISFIENNFLF